MLDKETLIKNLRINSMYRDALKMLKNDADRKKVIHASEGILIEFATQMKSVTDKIKSDPEFAEQLRKAIIESKVLITDDSE